MRKVRKLCAKLCAQKFSAPFLRRETVIGEKFLKTFKFQDVAKFGVWRCEVF